MSSWLAGQGQGWDLSLQYLYCTVLYRSVLYCIVSYSTVMFPSISIVHCTRVPRQKFSPNLTHVFCVAPLSTACHHQFPEAPPPPAARLLTALYLCSPATLTHVLHLSALLCIPPPTPDDPDQPVRPRLRAGLSNLQRSSAAAAAAGGAAAGAAAATAAAVGSSSSFTSSPGPGGGGGGAASTAASPGQLPPATARPGTAIQMTQLSSPATGVLFIT
jgi:hypothetical protein